jgi:hypothetical protein
MPGLDSLSVLLKQGKTVVPVLFNWTQPRLRCGC